MATEIKRPIALIIRDGWGKNPHPEWNKANAVYLAKHPVADRLLAEYPNADCAPAVLAVTTALS